MVNVREVLEQLEIFIQTALVSVGSAKIMFKSHLINTTATDSPVRSSELLFASSNDPQMESAN